MGDRYEAEARELYAAYLRGEACTLEETCAYWAAALRDAHARGAGEELERPCWCCGWQPREEHDPSKPRPRYDEPQPEPASDLHRCANCGDPVTSHVVDDEERRECNECECKQYVAPICRETFGTKCCALPAGHGGHHESRSGSCWPLVVVPEPAEGLSEDEIARMVRDAASMVYDSPEATALAPHIVALAAEVRRLREKLTTQHEELTEREAIEMNNDGMIARLRAEVAGMVDRARTIDGAHKREVARLTKERDEAMAKIQSVHDANAPDPDDEWECGYQAGLARALEITNK